MGLNPESSLSPAQPNRESLTSGTQVSAPLPSSLLRPHPPRPHMAASRLRSPLPDRHGPPVGPFPFPTPGAFGKGSPELSGALGSLPSRPPATPYINPPTATALSHTSRALPERKQSAVALFFELRVCSTSGETSPPTPASPALATATIESVVDRSSSAIPRLAVDPVGSPSPSSTRDLPAVYPRRRRRLSPIFAAEEDYEFIEEQEFYPEVPPSPFADQGNFPLIPLRPTITGAPSHRRPRHRLRRNRRRSPSPSLTLVGREGPWNSTPPSDPKVLIASPRRRPPLVSVRPHLRLQRRRRSGVLPRGSTFTIHRSSSGIGLSHPGHYKDRSAGSVAKHFRTNHKSNGESYCEVTVVIRPSATQPPLYTHGVGGPSFVVAIQRAALQSLAELRLVYDCHLRDTIYRFMPMRTPGSHRSIYISSLTQNNSAIARTMRLLEAMDNLHTEAILDADSQHDTIDYYRHSSENLNRENAEFHRQVQQNPQLTLEVEELRRQNELLRQGAMVNTQLRQQLKDLKKDLEEIAPLPPRQRKSLRFPIVKPKRIYRSAPPARPSSSTTPTVYIEPMIESSPELPMTNDQGSEVPRDGNTSGNLPQWGAAGPQQTPVVYHPTLAEVMTKQNQLIATLLTQMQQQQKQMQEQQAQLFRLQQHQHELSLQLIYGDFANFQRLVNKAIIPETRVIPPQAPTSAKPRTTLGGPSTDIPPQAPPARKIPAQATGYKRDRNGKPIVCFSCRQEGHYACKCPYPKRVPSSIPNPEGHTLVHHQGNPDTTKNTPNLISTNPDPEVALPISDVSPSPNPEHQ
ncbi:hypothetical protein GUJ93_ZPchr0013g35083 [Zizania palustris]|uniref:CCHC-type domain-containing protein n=1 Tax=Zizania palustris TaxID=103762 RepID=A0A8J5WZR4_ZIZPA|nr:hypothetical protein GUJ93_ZPchr0013g35083 [Zizania palustris]